MRRLTVLTLALLAAACGDATPPAGDAASPVASPAAARPPRVRTPPPPQEGGTPMTAAVVVRGPGGSLGPFRIAEVDRLVVEASYASGERGVLPARVDVLGPRGSVHTRLEGTFRPAAGAVTFARDLEVQGTIIETYQQVGRWTFRLSVGEGGPVAEAQVELRE